MIEPPFQPVLTSFWVTVRRIAKGIQIDRGLAINKVLHMRVR